MEGVVDGRAPESEYQDSQEPVIYAVAKFEFLSAASPESRLDHVFVLQTRIGTSR